jgi:hypothetical protein
MKLNATSCGIALALRGASVEAVNGAVVVMVMM